MLSADYIVGLTDGEGSFTVYPRPPQTGGRGGKSFKIELHYYLKLQEDDLGVLEKLKEFFGCGAIYLQKDKRENHTNCYRYEINHYDKIAEVVIPFFLKHELQSESKKRDFELFHEIFKMVQEKQHFTQEGLGKIMELKYRMHKNRARWMREIRSSSGNGKLTLKLFQSVKPSKLGIAEVPRKRA